MAKLSKKEYDELIKFKASKMSDEKARELLSPIPTYAKKELKDGMDRQFKKQFSKTK